MHWLALTDPLRIARDAECAYGQPAGFINSAASFGQDFTML
jgi:hypothetical protein